MRIVSFVVAFASALGVAFSAGAGPAPPAEAPPAPKAEVAAAPPSDAEITAAVAGALAEDPYTKGVPIAVAVDHGVVTLSGEVDSAFLARWAAETVSGVPGVEGVDNQITIPAPSLWPPDPVLKDRIELQLAYNPFVNGRRIHVQVEDGVATLTGFVDSLQARRSAAKTASEEQVRCVVESLYIRPHAPVYREPPPPLPPCPRRPGAQ